MNRKCIRVAKTNNYKGLCIRHTFVKREKRKRKQLRRQHQVLQRESYIILETLNPESKQRGCFGLCI